MNSLKPDSTIEDLCNLLKTLTIYVIYTPKCDSTANSSPRKLKFCRVKNDTLSSFEKLLNDVCTKLNSFWSKDLSKLDNAYRDLYVCFLSENGQGLFNILLEVNYKIDSQLIIGSTYKDDEYPILSVIKYYGTSEIIPAGYMWKSLFLFCYMEKKLLLKALIVILCFSYYICSY